MPARRKTVPAETKIETPVSPTVNGKRKRGAAALVQVEPEIQPSPRSRKRTKINEQDPSTNETPKQKVRRGSSRVDIKVEEELTTAITEQPNGTLEVEEEDKVTIEAIETPKKRSRKPKAKPTATEDADVNEVEDEASSAKPKRKRKTKEEKEAEAMPLAARTLGLNMYVGAHTSIAKGVENAITNCLHIGGNAFACFLKSQRKWENPELKDENRDAFRKALTEHKYDGMQHIVPHGSYLVNLATEDKDKSKQSYDAFIDDLHRCEALGIRYYNFHPGGAGQSPFEEAITRLANNLNRALSETKSVVPLLENMAGHGTLIGGRFSDLRDVIAQIKPEYKSRIGVCIDTCHAFAAGYDLRSPEAFKKTMEEFDQTVGMKYLKALHLNDSKMPLGSHRDLHQNIGLGFLGLRAFHNVMNEPRFQGLPLILETPSEKPDPDDPKGKKMIEDKQIWATEIKLLESLIGMDPEGDEFKQLESALSERGKEERDKLQAQFERITKEKAEKERKKLEKERKILTKEREKGQKSLADMFAPKASANAVKAKKPKKGKRGESPESELSEQSDSPLSDLSDLDEEEHRH
ncbi:DNA-(apurinic or apyrimidinic site) lyase [Cladophialophora chaetospira]|uniref:Apurinic-apyrimidinic endonuclease 1 n=1 Tax=Cladophialophora chaetospira TaxID=386627 RepID=A0AA38X1Y7_9EURO|nr:DNA-(apurinic or apyrimidinic site) lyase [Cladophialophora chaetospira]